MLNRLQVIRELGGRMNRHWLVESDGESKVLRRWGVVDTEYERNLIQSLADLGWPVAPLEDLVECDGYLWSLSPFLHGEPPPPDDPVERRARGRLLAEFHLATAQIEQPSQRPGWRRCEEILADESLDRTLSENEDQRAEEVRIVRWHLQRARQRVIDLSLVDWPSIPIHGDFTTWNLRFDEGQLSGIIDFELARQDHRIADFTLSWRGKYDEVIEGYEEVSPLSDEERWAITAVWWAQLVKDACREMRLGRQDDGWTIRKLLTRSPIMGPDADAVP